MVADDDAVAADLDGFAGVGDALDPLEAKWSAAADAFPGLDEPGDLLPAPGAAVPDAVDPGGAGALRVFGGVDAHFREARLEDRVREAEVGADAAVEGVVAGGDVVVTPAELPGVGGEDAGVEAGVEGTRQEGDCEFVVVGHVELVETGALAICGGDVFDWGRAGGGEAVREVELFGDGGDGEFAEGVVDFVDANGGEAEGGGHFMAEDCGGGVTEVGVDELAGNDTVTEEGLAWEHVSWVAGGGCGAYGWQDGCRIGQHWRRHRAFLNKRCVSDWMTVCQFIKTQLRDFSRKTGEMECTDHPPSVSFCFASSSSLPGSVRSQFELKDEENVEASPVLKGGTSPLFGFQKFSLWYSDHCGVLLLSMLGLLGSDMIGFR